MKFGELRLLLSKWSPGLDPDLLDGFINARARRIWEHRRWIGRQRTTVLTAAGAYNTGTVAIAVGSTAVIGTGTGWDGDMTGRRIRLRGSNEWYTFTFATSTTGTLDRAFAEASVTGQAYDIYQAILTLPAALSSLTGLKRLTPPGKLDQRSNEWLDEFYPQRPGLGPPCVFANYPASEYQAEVYPAPLTALSLHATYFARFELFTSTQTDIPEWMSWVALERGVRADIAGRLDDYTGLSAWESEFDRAVADMDRDEDRRTPAKKFRIAEHLLPPAGRGGARIRRVW